jgi:hypothetical protein
MSERELKHSLFMIQRQLDSLATFAGKDSKEYKQTLQKFKRLWAVLKGQRTEALQATNTPNAYNF